MEFHDIQLSHLFLLPVAAFLMAFFSSMGGVSGAFLLLPFQMSVLGLAGPVVSATNHLYNVLAIPGGLYQYSRDGRMVWLLAGVIVAGSLPGIAVGVWIRVEWLVDIASFHLFMGLVLAYIGIQTLYGAWRKPLPNIESHGVITNSHWRFSRLHFEFSGVTYRVSIWKLLLLSMTVGVVGGTYGIGGGVLLAPLLVSFFSLPIHIIAGATLLGTFASSLFAVLVYQLFALDHSTLSVAPNWILGALFGLGGLAGTYLGAKVQHRVPGKIIQRGLGLAILFIAVRYLF